MEFLGMTIDTCEMKLSVPITKLVKVQREAHQILRKEYWPARKLAATIGLMNSVCKAMSPGMLMTRFLLANLTDALLKNRNNWDTTKVKIWDTSKEELRWWAEEMSKYNGRPFQQSMTEITIQTDASETGWGGVCGDTSYSGSWSDSDYSPSSNMRELKAISKVIQATGDCVKNKKILVLSDNITAIANVVKEGGNNNTDYIRELKDLYWLIKSLNCMIVMRHIPGRNNVFADAASRRIFKDEYVLKQQAIDQIIRQWGRPSIDLFATSENHIVRKFFSWKADPRASATDAFSQSWNEEKLPYAHPPIRLIPKVIQKFKEERIKRMILVLPHWPSLPIWPRIMSQKRDQIFLPRNCIMGPPNHRLSIQNPPMIAILLQSQQIETHI